MKLICIIIALLCPLSFTIWASPTNDSTVNIKLRQLRNDLELLQAYKEIQAAAFQNNSVALDQKVEAVRNERESKTMFLIGGAIGVIVVVLGGWATVFLSLKSKTEIWIDTRLKTLFKDKSEALSLLLSRYSRINAFRSKKRLVVLCNSQERSNEMLELLRDKFKFKNVKPKVIHKYQTFKKADLVIVDHEHFNHEKPEESLSITLIEDFWENENSPMLLYFGPQNRALAKYTSKLSFANNQVTLFNRIIETFEYQEGVGLK